MGERNCKCELQIYKFIFSKIMIIKFAFYEGLQILK